MQANDCVEKQKSSTLWVLESRMHAAHGFVNGELGIQGAQLVEWEQQLPTTQDFLRDGVWRPWMCGLSKEVKQTKGWAVKVRQQCWGEQQGVQGASLTMCRSRSMPEGSMWRQAGHNR